MARGGKRQGTPGVAYENRTDLGADYAPQTGGSTAAAGGVAPPPPTQPGTAGSGPVYSMTPDQVPKLDDPNDERDAPISPLGQNAGAAMPATPAMLELRERNRQILDEMAARDDLPDRVARFVRHARSVS